MDFTKIRVLVLDGNSRQTLTMVHGLKELGCKVAVLCTKKSAMCYVSKLPDEKLLCPGMRSSEPDYYDRLRAIAATGHYDVLMPIGEMDTAIVTAHEEELKKYVKLACAPRSAFVKANNKQLTLQTAMELGIPCPYTRVDGQSVDDYLANAHFPIIIKPRTGMGSMGFHKFDTEADFRRVMAEEKIDPDEYVIQEFVDHEKRHGTYIFMDQNGEVKSALASEVLRWYPIDAGTSTISASVDDPEVIRYASQLLKALGWSGFANTGFMIDKKTGKPKLLEINGRIPAPVKLTWMCGINVARQFIEMAYGEEVTKYPENTKFGMMARHTQADLMWFIKSPDRFKAKPSWFSWKNTADLVYWKGDPLPAIVYTFGGLTQYKSFKAKRER